MAKHDQSARIAILTRPAPDACYIAQCLAESCALDLAAIVTEKRTQGQFYLLCHKLMHRWRRGSLLATLGFIMELPYLFWQDQRLLRAQKKAWWQGKQPTFPKNVPYYAMSNLNAPAAVQVLKKINADLFVIYGTRILQPQTFGCAHLGAINVHMGITPEYRGSKSEFWALYRNEPELVGLTAHMIDAGIDTGNVLAQQHLKVTPADDEISLRNKNVEAAVAVLKKVIQAITQGEMPTINVSDRKSRLFSTPSMLQYLQLHRRLRCARREAQ